VEWGPLPGHGRHADGGRAPSQHDGGQKDARVGFGKPKVAWELADEIADVEGFSVSVMEPWMRERVSKS